MLTFSCNHGFYRKITLEYRVLTAICYINECNYGSLKKNTYVYSHCTLTTRLCIPEEWYRALLYYGVVNVICTLSTELEHKRERRRIKSE